MLKRVIIGGLAMAMVLSASAQRSVRPYLGTFQKAVPDWVAPVEIRGGQVVVTGPRRPYAETPMGLAPRQVVFDSSDVDLFGVEQFGHKYGVDGAVVQFAEDTAAFAWVNDMYANPDTQGRVSYDWGVNFIWNPDGLSPISGTSNMVLLFLVGDSYFGSGFPFSSAGGWGLFFDNFNAGYYGVGVGGLGLSMPWTTPGAPACQLLQLATYDANYAISPATGAGQFMQFQMLSPTEPNPEYVGTNSSDSTDSCWIDFNNDFGWSFDEVFSLQNDFPIGRTQPMTAMLVNTADPVFEGNIEFEGVEPSTLRPIRAIRVQTRNHGESPIFGQPLVREEYIFLGPNGEFRATAPATPGVYDISFQGEHFLRRTIGPISISGPGNYAVGTIMLKNGNADHLDSPGSPSSIDISDYAVFSSYYGLEWPYPSYDAETCDLNRDDAIDIGDYALLSANYGLEGDY